MEGGGAEADGAETGGGEGPDASEGPNGPGSASGSASSGAPARVPEGPASYLTPQWALDRQARRRARIEAARAAKAEARALKQLSIWPAGPHSFARGRFLKGSPRKAKLAVEGLRGLRYADAVRKLGECPLRVADAILKVLKSAADNAEHETGRPKATLAVVEAWTGQGPVLKRLFPRARGQSDVRRKPSFHVRFRVAYVPLSSRERADLDAARRRAAARERVVRERAERRERVWRAWRERVLQSNDAQQA